MRILAALALFIALLLSACGGGPPSPESVVRAWSQALNEGDNESAADMFAPGARVVQVGSVLRLRTHEQAVSWHEALPCSGEIVALETKGEDTTATFELGDRETSACDGPGSRASAVFKVRDGKIVLWHQLSSARAPGGNSI